MKNTMLRVAIASLAGMASQQLWAEAPSYNYVQFDYIVSGDTEFDEKGFASRSFDLQQGYGVRGGFEIGEYAVVMGRHLSLDYDGEDTFGSDDIVVNDSTFIGAGMHMPIADMFDVYGVVGFSRPTATQLSGQGFGIEIGARASFEMVEASLWYNVGRTDTRAGDETVDIDPEMLGLDVAISFAPDAPQLVLGYVDATHNIKDDTVDLDLNYDHFSVGVRKTF